MAELWNVDASTTNTANIAYRAILRSRFLRKWYPTNTIDTAKACLITL